MLSKLFSKGSEEKISWNRLNDLSQLDEIDESSKETPVLIFKHSTSCGISAMALNRFERNYDHQTTIKPYYLDLLSYRDISNEISTRYSVRHESPQVLVIKEGKATYHNSHNGIDFTAIDEFVKEQQ